MTKMRPGSESGASMNPLITTERGAVRVLGVPVDALTFEQAQTRVMAWGHAHESRYVVLANVHVVVSNHHPHAVSLAVRRLRPGIDSKK
jgi:UDP-N-acetyl-D-mannosaminuronic acid transferase (WecB/TagA/CpsF family)